MIADTTFISHLFRERERAQRGPASAFLAAHRRESVRTSIITVGEVAPIFETSRGAWEALSDWTIYRLHPGIADAAADVDREMMRLGARLGENDNWIAGFCRYYRQPVLSLDEGFDRVPGLRRVRY